MGTNKRYVISRAKQWALGEASTGKEQVAVSFAVPNENGDGEHFVAWYGYFTEGAVDRTIESLRYMGFEGDNLLELVGLDKNEVELVIEDEEYEGKIHEKVQWINKPGGALVKKALEGDKAKTFAALMKEKFRIADASAGKKPVRQAAKTPPPAGPLGGDPPPSDDIPF
jgi:hypothetical protein